MARARSIVHSILILTLVTGIAGADDRAHKFQQGNEFYRNGDYDNAIATYEEILQGGYENAELYYNLGNAHYKIGNNSGAILNYERGLRLRPNDEDIRFNLQIANLSVVDKIPAIPELFYIRYYREFRNMLIIHTLTIATLVLYLALFTALTFWIVARRGALRPTWKLVSVALAMVFVASSFILISKIVDQRRNIEAIVMVNEVDVRSAPSGDGTEIFTIHEGLKIKITELREEWYEIRLSDGKQGWLQSNTIEII